MQQDVLAARYGPSSTRETVVPPEIDEGLLADLNIQELIEDRLMESHKRAINYLSDRFDRIDRLRRLSSQCIIPQSANKVQQYVRLFRACSALDSAVTSLESSLIGSESLASVEEPVNIPPQFADAEVLSEPHEDNQNSEEERIITCGL